nr:hypothetical protein [Tanacetum cinerariifolium]
YCSCSKGSVKDKILVSKPPKNYARCARCGHPVDGPYCQGCALLRKELEKNLVTHFQDFQNTSESSDDNTNVVNAPREPFVVKQDQGSFVDKLICDLHTFSPNQRHCFHCKDVLGDGEACQRCTCKRCGSGLIKGLCLICGNNQNFPNDSLSISVNYSHNPPHIDERCFECGDALDGIFCQQCAFVESPNVFNPPPQPPIYSCEFCGSNARYGHCCTPQVLLIYPEPGYSQDFNSPQNFYDFQQQYICCDQCGGPHETFQCQQVISYEPCCENCRGPHKNFQCQPLNYYEPNPSYDSNHFGFDQFGDFHPQQDLCCDNCEGLHETSQCQPMNQNFYNSNSSGFDQTQPPQSPVIHSPPQETSIKILHDQEKNCRTFIDDDDDDVDYTIAITPEKPDNSLKVEKIVILEDEEIEDDNLREKLLKVNLLIAEIEALKDNPTPSSEFLTKSSSTSPKPFLEGTDTFDNFLPEFENFYFDLEEISSGSTTTHSDISLSEYKAFSFYDDHIEEISSGSTTTTSDISLSEYDSFIFDLSNDQFPPTDRSDFTHEEFGNEPAHIIYPSEYDCFYFRNLPDPAEWISSLNFGICENLSSTTCVNLQVEDDHSPLLAYVVWIFLAYLTYLVIPLHLHSFRNKDTIFDPGITINRFYSFKPGLSHRCGTFKKFNTHRSHLNESPMVMLFSTFFPMNQMKNKQEPDKIGTKPDQIKKKQKAWKSPKVSKSNHSQDSRKEKKYKV